MKKVLIVLTILLFLVGCSLSNTPSGRVEEYLSNYNNLSEEVLMDIDAKVMSSNLSNDNKESYKKVLKREYENMRYEIKDEIINGDKASVVVKISVYDLYKAEKDASKYMNENIEQFYYNNTYSNSKYIDYKLEEMKKETERVTYTIDFNVSKNDGSWVVEQPSKIDLEKIHGIYNYQ